jgi:DNA-binding beta-propeller fold protein YncE
VYFTAIGANGPGVFSMASDGTNTKEIKAGDPFAAPFGIASSSDGKSLVIADPGADVANKDAGGIHVMPVGGGATEIIAGSADTVPRGVTVAVDQNKDFVFFTGNDKTDGSPGVFKVEIAGGTATTIVKGGELRDPSGITVAGDGSIYVCDTVADNGNGLVFKITGTTAAQWATGLRVGYPCGIALSQDGATLYLSGLDPASGTNRLIAFDVVNKMQTLLFEAEAKAFGEPAGLHRSHSANVFSWVESQGGTMGGKIFVIQ